MRATDRPLPPRVSTLPLLLLFVTGCDGGGLLYPNLLPDIVTDLSCDGDSGSCPSLSIENVPYGFDRSDSASFTVSNEGLASAVVQAGGEGFGPVDTGSGSADAFSVDPADAVQIGKGNSSEVTVTYQPQTFDDVQTVLELAVYLSEEAQADGSPWKTLEVEILATTTPDGDGDDYYHEEYVDSSGDNGLDCNDANATINPAATETWYDGTDQNCDDANDYDADGDGYESETYGGEDCEDDPATNENAATIKPDATEEWYDGIDQNCDDANDYDADGDGYDGESASGNEGPDCDDTDPDINPDAEEIPGDGVDQNCDGSDDE